MSNYILVDPIISAWVQKHGLSLFTLYKDSEVRSVDVIGINGRRFQIWIDRPQENKVAIHVWDYKKKRKDFEVSITDLNIALENSIDTARAWGNA